MEPSEGYTEGRMGMDWTWIAATVLLIGAAVGALFAANYIRNDRIFKYLEQSMDAVLERDRDELIALIKLEFEESNERHGTVRRFLDGLKQEYDRTKWGLVARNPEVHDRYYEIGPVYFLVEGNRFSGCYADIFLEGTCSITTGGPAADGDVFAYRAVRDRDGTIIGILIASKGD